MTYSSPKFAAGRSVFDGGGDEVTCSRGWPPRRWRRSRVTTGHIPGQYHRRAASFLGDPAGLNGQPGRRPTAKGWERPASPRLLRRAAHSDSLRRATVMRMGLAAAQYLLTFVSGTQLVIISDQFLLRSRTVFICGVRIIADTFNSSLGSLETYLCITIMPVHFPAHVGAEVPFG